MVAVVKLSPSDGESIDTIGGVVSLDPLTTAT